MQALRDLQEKIKSSLNIKFILFYVAVSLVPLVLIVAFFYTWGRSTLVNNSKEELNSKSTQIAATVSRFFNQQENMMLQLAGNPAFVRRYTEPQKSEEWRREVEKAFQYIRSVYPAELDEACYIDRQGPEVARIVGDIVASAEDLSEDESGANFFKPTFDTAKGKVYQSKPYISADSGRWVVASTTPIVLPNGKKAALSHFEINLGAYKTLLNDTIRLKEGQFVFIVDRETGKVIVHTKQPAPKDKPFKGMASAFGIKKVEREVDEMLTGEKGGVMQMSINGTPYLVGIAPIKAPAGNANKWTVAMAQPLSSAFEGSTLFGMLIVFIAAGVGVVVLSSSAVSRKVVRPLQATASKIDEIAEGDGDLTTALPVLTHDEVGQIARSFNSMLARIRDLISQIQASGAGNHMGHATVADLAEAAHQISENSSSLAGLVNDSVRHVQEGKSSVDQLVAATESIQSQVDEMAVRVDALGQKSQQIGVILELIDDIARQTNLLALNAAIEAARAGEQGKGFAVVATEVRRLAERSLASTKDIESLVIEIQNETQTTIQATDATKEEVEKGAIVAKQAGQALDSLAQIVESTRTASRNISDATQSQQQASDEVASTMEQVQQAVMGYKV